MAKVLLVGMHNADNQYIKMLEKYGLDWEQVSDRGAGRFPTDCDAALIVTSQVNLQLQREVMAAYKGKKMFFTSGGVSVIRQKLEDWVNTSMKTANVEALGGLSNFTFYALATKFADCEFSSRDLVDYVEGNATNEVNPHSVTAKVHDAKTRGFIQEVGKNGQSYIFKFNGLPLHLVNRLEAFGFKIPDRSVLGGRNQEDESIFMQEPIKAQEPSEEPFVIEMPVIPDVIPAQTTTAAPFDDERAQVIYLKLEDIQNSIDALSKQTNNTDAMRQAVRQEIQGILNVEESLHLIAAAFPGMTTAMAQKMIKLYKAATEE